MSYPSLLYFDKEKAAPLDMAVFEDLQLLNFLTPEAAAAAAVPCSADNISARQELFHALESHEMRSLIDSLAESMAILKNADAVYDEARCEPEKHCSYAVLLGALFDFAELSSGLCKYGGRLAGRMGGFFCQMLSDGKNRELKEKASGLLSKLDSALKYTFRLHERSMKISSGRPLSYFERICRCSQELGTGEIIAPPVAKKQLSPGIIDGFSRIYPDLFKELAGFYKAYSSFYDSSVLGYGVQLEFIRSMLAFFDRIREAGIPLNYPVTLAERRISIKNAYDVTLLAKNEKNIVPNDISFTPAEPFYYLTGANGGGKTTYLRTVGVGLLFFLCGCPVPCERAEIFPPDCVFTHFPRDERFDGTGRFVEEQNRVNRILERMTENSVVLLNETYSSTNEENAVKHTAALAEELYSKKIFGLYITHQHSIAETEIPYLNVLVSDDGTNRRTFKIARQRSQRGSMARDILERYRLTKEALEERFGNGI